MYKYEVNCYLVQKLKLAIHMGIIILWTKPCLLQQAFSFLFRWDECVQESRILKYSDANLLKQKELQSQHPE